ncbi:ADP-ribosylation factor-like protein 6-interacting protein 1 isoform X2 [Anabrus simplex]|uniref:ADP-ribosylation factor-like protein 6-interacting protein 1 isoform X2 n=1 Tax=Anabrus simplex TaxID=316456 RepID=UPI0035A2FFBE
MAESMTADEQEKRRRDLAKEIKRDLEGWREVILPLHSVLLWERKWYPWMLISLTTCGFLLFWYLNPSVLTTISVIGIIITLVDYLVPTLTASLCRPDSWTGLKERKLEEISIGIVDIMQNMSVLLSRFYDLRQSRPTMYFGAVVIFLAALAYLGHDINNLLLTYLFGLLSAHNGKNIFHCWYFKPTCLT